MARFTTAYSSFLWRLKEVEVLQNLAASAAAGLTRNMAQSNALCRSGVVMLCSHVEGYIDELAQVMLDRIVERGMEKSRLGDPLFYHLSRDLITDIGQTTDPTRNVEKIRLLLSRDADIWVSGSTFSQPLSKERFMSNFATPKFDRLDSLLKRFGYEDFTKDLGGKLTSQFPICTNMLDQLVEQRNKIAHGDSVTTSTHNDLAKMIALVRLLIRSTDEVVGTWYSKNKCPIR